jgi:hypothetical protein
MRKTKKQTGRKNSSGARGKSARRKQSITAPAAPGAVNFEALETRQLMAVISVTDYGARANDNADDRGAVQAAINASKPGDTILFSGGTFNFSDGLLVPGDRTYKGQNGATLKGRSAEGQLLALHSGNVTFTGLTFDGGGVFIDSSAGGFDQNVVFDSNVFKLNTSGIHANAISFTSGLQNSRITNNYFTGYTGGFGVYGYNYNGLTIANNEFVNITAGMHIDAFSNSGNLLVEQNYLSGTKRMGFEFQSSATNLVFQDNWYEHPNLSSSFAVNSDSMAYSLILDKSSNITIRRNVVIAPERPDGVGCRIGFEVGGDNTLVEDNYINGVNHVVAVNDGVGTASVTVRNNKFLNYLQGAGMSYPGAGRSWTNTNNGPNTTLSSTMQARIAANDKPGIGSKRYGVGGSGGTVTPPPPVGNDPAVSAPASPSGLAAIVTGANTVNLFWTDRAYNEDGYKVEQSTDGGKTWTQVAQLKPGAATLTLKNLIAGKSHSFRVCAFNEGGNSSYTNSISVTPNALDPSAGTYVSDMDWTSSKNYWGPAERDMSNGEVAGRDGRQLTIAGKSFVKGIGVHAGSEIRVNLGGDYAAFLSTIGLDDETFGNGSVVFEVWADGVKLYSSGTMNVASGRKNVSVDVSGRQELVLRVTNAGDTNDFDHADWGNARLLPTTAAPDPTEDPRTPPPSGNPPDGVVYLADMDWDSMTNGWGAPERNRSNGEKKGSDGRAITLNGKTYATGIGAHSTGDIRYNLGGKYATFTADVGIDDEVGGNGSVIFQVYADGVKLYDSGVMTGATATRKVNVNVQGRQELWLVVQSAGDGRTFDHADWADAKLTLAPNAKLPAGTYLSDLQPVSQTNGWGPVETDSSIGEKLLGDGSDITLNRRVYTKGLGVHSDSKLVYQLGGQYTTFITDFGIDDEVGQQGSVTFQIYADGQLMYDSGLMTGASQTKNAVVNVDGKQQLWLVVTNGGDNFYFDHADWANARLIA